MTKKFSSMVQLALFTAIQLIFCFTVLGSIPIGPIVMTLATIPAIVAAQLLGKKSAAFLGLVMGVSSLIVWTYTPPNPAVAFAFSPFVPNGNFWSLVIVIVPRVIFPVVTVLVFDMLIKKVRPVWSAAISAGVGSVVHSLLVLSGIYFFFHDNPNVGGNYIKVIVGWGGLNAVIECVLAIVISSALIIPLIRFRKGNSLSA